MPHIMSVTLRRDGFSQPWGISINGGADLGTPIVITRSQVGTPSEGELKRGDTIKKITDYDARDLGHDDAQMLFKNAGNTISLVIERQGGPQPAPAAGRSQTQPLPTMSYVAPPQPKPPVAGGVATPFAQAVRPERTATPNFSPAAAAAPRKNQLPVVFPPPLPSSMGGRTLDERGEEMTEESIGNQPYRTTPLVLPGAKVKKEASATQSYLRHHPNPMFRATPSHYDTSAETMMKQKVADTVLQRVVGEDASASGKQVVHRQFNSPIGLYSEQNIADTIQSQTGATPSRTSTLDRRNQVPVSMKKTYVYDPAKSETFKALKESEFGDTIQEVTVPVQTKVFTPNKGVTFKKPAPAPQTTFVNSLGNYEEKIQQSGSFRRLMNQVLGESEY